MAADAVGRNPILLVVAAVGVRFGLLGAVFGFLTAARPTVTAAGATPPRVAGSSLADLPTLGLAGTLAAVVLYVVAAGVFGGLFAAYSTAFYREIRPEGGDGGDAPSQSPSSASTADA